MFNWTKPEVLVVGAGPVGMLTALALAKHGVRVRIIDRQLGTVGHSYALALHVPTLSLLKELGLLEDVLTRAHRVRSAAIYVDHQRRGVVRLADSAAEYPFVAVLQQSELETLLENALERAGVKVHWRHELAQLEQVDDHVAVTVDRLDKESLGYSVAHTEWVVSKSKATDVKFVIGADGFDSDVRRALGIPSHRVSAPRHFAVFEFKSDAELGEELHLSFDDGRSNVLWPLPEGYYRWSFELAHLTSGWETREKDHFLLQPPGAVAALLQDESLRHLLHDRAPWFDGSVDEIRWRAHVQFDPQWAESFGRGRVWLAGDAGHVTVPAGAQSMNVGLREGYELAHHIAGILRSGTSADVLEQYNTERLAEWDFLHGMRGRPGTDEDTPGWVSSLGHELIASLPSSGNDLKALAGQLGLRSPAAFAGEAG